MRRFRLLPVFLLLTILALSLIGCSSPPTPPKPLSITGSWKVAQIQGGRPEMEATVEATAALEYEAIWSFTPGRDFKMKLRQETATDGGMSGRYNWDSTACKLEIEGSYNFFFDIKRLTDDSLILFNTETELRYSFTRFTSDNPYIRRETFMAKPPDSTLRAAFAGAWELNFLMNAKNSDKTFYYYLKEKHGKLIWQFSPTGQVALEFAHQNIQGKWGYDPLFKKLVIKIADNLSSFRVVTISQEIITLESIHTGAKWYLKRLKSKGAKEKNYIIK